MKCGREREGELKPFTNAPPTDCGHLEVRGCLFFHGWDLPKALTLLRAAADRLPCSMTVLFFHYSQAQPKRWDEFFKTFYFILKYS